MPYCYHCDLHLGDDQLREFTDVDGVTRYKGCPECHSDAWLVESRDDYDRIVEGLKPCPCCGGRAKHIRDFDPFMPACYSVFCACGMQTEPSITLEAAAEIWNRREPYDG